MTAATTEFARLDAAMRRPRRRVTLGAALLAGYVAVMAAPFWDPAAGVHIAAFTVVLAAAPMLVDVSYPAEHTDGTRWGPTPRLTVAHPVRAGLALAAGGLVVGATAAIYLLSAVFAPVAPAESALAVAAAAGTAGFLAAGHGPALALRAHAALAGPRDAALAVKQSSWALLFSLTAYLAGMTFAGSLFTLTFTALPLFPYVVIIIIAVSGAFTSAIVVSFSGYPYDELP